MLLFYEMQQPSPDAQDLDVEQHARTSCPTCVPSAPPYNFSKLEQPEHHFHVIVLQNATNLKDHFTMNFSVAQVALALG